MNKENIVIAGHGRLTAARSSGIAQVPTIKLDDLSADQIRAYVIADNRLAEKAGWGRSVLAIELQHLLTIDDDLDVTITGFEMSEIDLILSAPNVAQYPDDTFEPDDAADAVSRPGDLWQLGRRRLLCGSAIEPDSYSKLLGTTTSFVPRPATTISVSRSAAAKRILNVFGRSLSHCRISFLTNDLRRSD